MVSSELKVVKVNYLDKSVVEMVMNRPQSLNAVDLQLARELIVAMEEIEADKDVRIVIVKGEGRAFCAGADLKEMSAGLTKEEHFQKLMDLEDVGRIMRNSDKIFIGAVQGYCVGIGFEIALACDQIIAAENAVFRFPEVEIDATVTGGGHKLLFDAVGSLFKAKELLFRGTKISGAYAVELGIANQVVADAELDSAARAYANELKEKPSSLVYAKHMMNVATQTKIEDLFNLEVVQALHSASFGQRSKMAGQKIAK